ncbi:hypothetical protein LSUE1_G001138 [Lachnellula suecica]|uniref:Uncharacterized protein n=1 Tax=Lachnellula suecica TaxID=602035 RepID=A0A8T9CI24_9HELO|nr:hypothetical protein LSUE1_G001138 [Lachnellula suecica]
MIVFMIIQQNLKGCKGTSCTLTWVVVGLAGVLAVIASYTAVVSVLDWRYFKGTGTYRGSEMLPKV